jgi:hypothetical protein
MTKKTTRPSAAEFAAFKLLRKRAMKTASDENWLASLPLFRDMGLLWQCRDKFCTFNSDFNSTECASCGKPRVRRTTDA